MKNKLFSYLFLISAIGLAVLTRYYKLGSAPKGLYIDEAAQGYNAYSILKTGKDEFGKIFPIVFRSFTDFKTPVYIYLIVPLINIFGLSAYTVRFPSFLFSIMTIPILYFLVLKLSESRSLAIIASLLLAISPWHILFGRTNFECNVALFFYLSGVYVFFLSLNKPRYFILSAILFAIAIPAYHSQRVITPLTLIILFLKYKKLLFAKFHKKWFLIGLVIGGLLSIPTLTVATTPGFLMRAAGLNIFSKNGWNIFASIKEFFSLYTSYFTPRNMFILGDYGPRSSFPELSTFFLWQMPLYFHGLYLLVKDKKYKDLKFFVIFSLAIGPIPAAVTRDPYATIRALPLVIPQIIVISMSIEKLFGKNNQGIKKIILGAVSILILFYSLGKIYSSVFILNEYYRAKYWDYGWEETVNLISNLNPGTPVIVDNARYEPYSQILFFLKFDPSTYQKSNFEVPLKEYYLNMSRNKEKKIGNIVTRGINWENDLSKEQYLVGDELAISEQQIKEHHLQLIAEILYPDKSVAIRIVKTNHSNTPEKR